MDLSNFWWEICYMIRLSHSKYMYLWRTTPFANDIEKWNFVDWVTTDSAWNKLPMEEDRRINWLKHYEEEKTTVCWVIKLSEYYSTEKCLPVILLSFRVRREDKGLHCRLPDLFIDLSWRYDLILEDMKQKWKIQDIFLWNKAIL